jgi:hypothetical protein
VSVAVVAAAALAYAALKGKQAPVHQASPAPSPVQQAASGAQQAVQGVQAVIKAAPQVAAWVKGAFGSIFG